MLAQQTDLSTLPGARQVRKLPVPVHARFADADGVCQTLEGPVPYHAGDAILTGVRGEQWPMLCTRFKQSYEPLPGQPGQYRKRPQTVLALRLDHAIEVAVNGRRGVLRGQPGDWLLQYGPGDFGVVAADIFDETYRFV
nr:PGDYG domain-containing protein [Duganella sp. 1224]